jgi:hypothetical protein
MSPFAILKASKRRSSSRRSCREFGNKKPGLSPGAESGEWVLRRVASGPTSIAFSVRHATYDESVMVTGFEDMWGTAIISPDGGSLEVSRVFAETDANGREEYRHARTATLSANECGETLKVVQGTFAPAARERPRLSFCHDNFAYAVVGPDGRSCDPEWSQTARADRLQSPNGEQMRCR